MTWDGNGNITWPHDWTDDRDAGGAEAQISAAKFDEQWAAAKANIEACLNRNGENAIAADINWGGYKIENLGAATGVNDVPRARQVAENTLQYGGTTGGSSNAYTYTNAFISSVTTGTRLLLKANHTNTGAATLGGAAIVRADGSTALSAGDIVSGDFFEVARDGSNWVLLGAATGAFPGGSVTVGIDDDTPGAITIYGGGAGESGGQLRLHQPADEDGTNNYFAFQVYEGDFRIARDNGSASDVIINESGQLTLASDSGAITIGTSDSVPASVSLMGGGAGENGALFRLYEPADEDGTVDYWSFYADFGDLLIRRETTTNMLFYDSGTIQMGQINGTVQIGADDTTNGLLSIFGDNGSNGAVLRLYQGASDDTTSDYTYLSADAGYFLIRSQLAAGGEVDGFRLYSTGNVQLARTSGVAEVGGADDVPGQFYVNGGGAGEDGGLVRWYQGADDDGTNDYVQAIADAGGLTFEIANGNDILVLNEDRTVELPGYGAGILQTDSSGNVSAAALRTEHSSSPAATTSGTTVDFTSIPAGTTRIDVFFNEVSFAVSDTPVIQLGDSGGIETTGYIGDAAAPGGSATSTTYFPLSGQAIGAGNNFTGAVTLRKNDGNTWFISGVGYRSVVSGRKATSATLDRIRITSISGNTFDAGAVSVFYYSE